MEFGQSVVVVRKAKKFARKLALDPLANSNFG
jgi:hypothetical protein